MNRPKRIANKGIALVKKSNSLIESRYKFDIWETRFFLSVLSLIRREETEFNTYRIWYKDIVKVFGLKSNQSYHLLREGAKSLMDKSFFVSYEQGGVTREVKYHILRKLDYLKEGEEAKGVETQEYIDVVVEDEMKPLLLQLQKNFTAYDLRNVRKLGAYPVRVYELLKQYESIGERTIYVDEMKRMFEMENEYPRFPNFYQKVLKPAITEINKHTDLYVTEAERIKEGKRVVAIVFHIARKDAGAMSRVWGVPETAKTVLELPLSTPRKTDPPPAPNTGEQGQDPETSPQTNPEPSDRDRIFLKYQQAVVTELGVSPSVFMQELARCTEIQIQKAIRVTQRARKDGRLKNPSGFFIEALRRDYTDVKEEFARRKQEEHDRKFARLRMEQEIEDLEYELGRFVNDHIRELTTEHPDATDTAITNLRRDPVTKTYIQNREQELARPLEIEDFRQDKTLRDWVKNRLIAAHADRFQPTVGNLTAKIERLRAAMG